MSEVSKEMFKGDHKTYELVVTKISDGSRADITAGVLIYTVKIDGTDTTATIQKSSENAGEIDITDPVEGEAEINLVPADTQDLEPTTYVFDVEFTDSAGKKSTVVTGTLKLKQDVTN